MNAQTVKRLRRLSKGMRFSWKSKNPFEAVGTDGAMFDMEFGHKNPALKLAADNSKLGLKQYLNFKPQQWRIEITAVYSDVKSFGYTIDAKAAIKDLHKVAADTYRMLILEHGDDYDFFNIHAEIL